MAEVNLSGEKKEVFNNIREYLNKEGFNIVTIDDSRPWGGFFVIDESQAEKFANKYFPGISTESLQIGGKLSPKILVVEASKRLSWQYHHRRAEIWKLVAGTAGVITSKSDKEGELRKPKINEILRLEQGERHRLVGLDGWGMIAEIWQHTDASNPSDENDIVRVQDDFGR
ncbi:MAG: phosphoheptose isomerase [Candidatus Cyclobacteriaceae bacterium M2_1C_046]